MSRPAVIPVICVAWFFPAALPAQNTDGVAALQADAIRDGQSNLGWWGIDPDNYTQWRSHSNRLIPVYTFGTGQASGAANLEHYTGANSPYRSEAKVRRLYGFVPERTVNPQATWLDQTNIADLQRAAAEAGKKHIFLVVFDGMDWQTTRAAAVYNQRAVTYQQGRGSGTWFQEYQAGGTAQFGFMVTSPHNQGTDFDVNTQTVENPGGRIRGGYDASAGGNAPWQAPAFLEYLLGKPSSDFVRHAYTDSAASAASMTTGLKTYNGAISVGPDGAQATSVAHELQEQGWAVGVVSSVPISHATPACAYAHNVSRKDTQDISRDLLGLPSIAHPHVPLAGMDVVLGGGWGVTATSDSKQGDNFEPGSTFLADSDLTKADVDHGGRYVTAVRTQGHSGSALLTQAVRRAIREQHRLLGFFGVGDYDGHLPFATANGDYHPVPGNRQQAEQYSAADLNENPNLSELTTAAIDVLSQRQERFWLLVEAGDVDWANHDNNLDNSIGAVNSGDRAFRVITDWVETHSNWDESVVILTADHGHLLNLADPEVIAQAAP